MRALGLQRFPAPVDGGIVTDPAAVTPVHHLHLPSLRAVAKQAVPNVLEATMIPSALLYTAIAVTGSVWPGAIAALLWAVARILARRAKGRRIPGILVLAAIGLTMRTAVAMISGSTFLYFLQPIVTTFVVSGLFALSLRHERPMAARLAADFCPITPEIAGRQRIQQLFRRLTLLWCGVNAINGMVALWLLTHLDSQSFVATKTGAAAAVTYSAVAFTIAYAIRVTAREGIRRAAAATAG
jgi:hypothetical protein